MLHNPLHHGPNRLSSYLRIHDTALERFKVVGEFVGEDTLQVLFEPGFIRMKGEVSCLANIIIDVDKVLKYVDSEPDPLVQTVEYKYNVHVRGQSTIFRYDNQDSYWMETREDHFDLHHKHLFDWETGEQEFSSPVWIGEENWPVMSQVIEEAQQWYWDRYNWLSDRHTYAELTAVGSTSLE